MRRLTGVNITTWRCDGLYFVTHKGRKPSNWTQGLKKFLSFVTYEQTLVVIPLE